MSISQPRVSCSQHPQRTSRGRSRATTLDGCLQALRQAETGIAWELVAVMNDASEESRAVLAQHHAADPRILAVWPGQHVQFALGCNLGFAASCGERVVFRDGQTLGYPLYAGLDGALACCRRDHQLQAVTGACLALRAADFAAVRGFDAGFLNSQEDVDLCLRLLQLPDRHICVSTAATTAIHSESVAPGRFRHTRWSRTRFVQRWQGQINADDLATYSRNGMAVTGWREDSAAKRREGLGAGRAILEPATPALKVAVGRGSS